MKSSRANCPQLPVGISLDNWLLGSYSRWSFQHVEDMVATAVIPRGTGPASALPEASAPVAEIPVISTDGAATNRWGSDGHHRH